MNWWKLKPSAPLIVMASGMVFPEEEEDFEEYPPFSGIVPHLGTSEESYFDPSIMAKESNTECLNCGRTKFFVNYLPTPKEGCYLKITCAHCETPQILHENRP